ncbi:NAD-dependent epimerase/dehydratase family protein [Jatrophihabitans endophyticus]|uniref:NAD-dependent epimerase/dehydratase family protein n=1 Tax=Jatrophihabitans endophyticus TaxID=1206085 RepID=UPI0019E22163|nr:NAD-dependent epimerase/dehydratase family protein [Jatrophihabitans endophyticus]MBE7187463.1 NAD-dependent epimerase/dehydratase family protein [Jatrophihabitans endophyticus]
MGNVVLIAGVSGFVGGRLAALLCADPSVERVIGVDTVPPKDVDRTLLGRTEFVRADIRNPLIGKVLSQARVTTVVHSALVGTHPVAGRSSMHEMNVIGTMQLLAACQKSDDLERVVLKSTTAVYDCRPSDPAVFTEDVPLAAGVGAGASGFARDAIEVEGYIRGFSRRRPDVHVSVLRLAAVIGPTIDSPLTRYLRTPVVPVNAGFDPRLQLLHETDAVESLRLAALSARPGTFNVAGDGVLPLSQVIRRVGRVRVPVPSAAFTWTGRTVRQTGLGELMSEQPRYLRYGRAVDTTALHERFGYVPRFDTAAAVASFAAGQRRQPRIALAGLGALAGLRGAEAAR